MLSPALSLLEMAALRLARRCCRAFLLSRYEGAFSGRLFRAQSGAHARRSFRFQLLGRPYHTRRRAFPIEARR